MLNLRQYAPATERNRQPILDVLQQVLPKSGTVLEIASGTGEHAAFLAPNLTDVRWLPTEQVPELRESIQAWGESVAAGNLILPPLSLNVSDRPWPVEADNFAELPITAIVNINMIHISAWEMCGHLMSGAARVLSAGGVLYLYGPFRQAGQPLVESNQAFDLMLRDRNSKWGIRDLAAVVQLAEEQGFKLARVVEMPANNLSVVFHRV